MMASNGLGKVGEGFKMPSHRIGDTRVTLLENFQIGRKQPPVISFTPYGAVISEEVTPVTRTLKKGWTIETADGNNKE